MSVSAVDHSRDPVSVTEVHDLLVKTPPIDTLSITKRDSGPVFDRTREYIDFMKSDRHTNIALFIEKQEIIKTLLLQHEDEVIDRSRRILYDAQVSKKLSLRASEKAEENKTFWDGMLNTVSGVTGAVNICVGITLMTSGGPLGIIGGACLVIAGLTGVATPILEQVGVKNEATMAVQIVGCVAGLASGGFSLFTSADKLPLIMKIGTAMLYVAGHSASVLSTYNQQQSLINQEAGARYDAILEKDRDVVKMAAKLLTHISEEDYTTKAQLIEALKREERMYRKMIKKFDRG